MAVDSLKQLPLIYEEYYPKILRYLIRFLGPNEAEDATQEVFIKINTNLDSFRGESKLSTWIYRIATNTAIDRKRRRAANVIEYPFTEI